MNPDTNLHWKQPIKKFEKRKSITSKNEFTDRFIRMILLKENRNSLKDINLTRLSKKIQIPVPTFHQWLTGAFPKRLEHWKKIQKYFNCDLTSLITGTAKEKKAIPNEGKIIVSEKGKKLLQLNFNVMKNSEIELFTP